MALEAASLNLRRWKIDDRRFGITGQILEREEAGDGAASILTAASSFLFFKVWEIRSPQLKSLSFLTALSESLLQAGRSRSQRLSTTFSIE